MSDDHVVIIGGGAVGSSIARYLTRPASQAARPCRVTVLERDFSYARASSALSASSIRQQFSTAINMAISAYGIGVLRDAARELAVPGEPPPQIGLHEGGYLYLATPAGEGVLRDNHARQRASGADVALLSPAELQARFPWLATEGIALGSLGLSGEGWFDGYSLLQAFRAQARAQGARYVPAEAVGFEMASRGSRPSIGRVQLSNGEHVDASVVVNAAGPWARHVAAWAGIALPVVARRRTVFHVSCPVPLPRCPLLIDPSGIWLRPEGAGFITGFAPPPDQDGDDLPLDEPDHAAFEAFVWPTLAARIPAFEALRLHRAWAGYYEMNGFDHNAIVGPHPACDNLIFANGFSGHGLQQSPAVGCGVAEWIAHGGYRTLDLSPLGWARVLENRPLQEQCVI
ncbi:FAD-binding oxidoreductase [Ottowia beijingensis]|uniref:FAD-binding oxidoreductase n=1 Tax=Ottowia beijingensis TaxID=1207057 RepID=A0A853IMD3_9BURK|nr:FAD-dependent oxidoreductase [Ottowia beijingensis]NZA01442.1 FAD-binding oxidoreductase [Ottowia beijingensis]